MDFPKFLKRRSKRDQHQAESIEEKDKQLQQRNDALKEKDTKIEDLQQRIEEKDKQLQQRNDALKENDTKIEDLQQSFTQKETYYKKKLNEVRSAKNRKDEELKSVKDRLSAQVAISLKTGDTESMNNPVSKSRLLEMYDNLRLLQWPKIKDELKSRNMSSKDAKRVNQKTFEAASEEMKRRKRQVEDIFPQTESNSGVTPQKVKEYREQAVQNLQMALFHSDKISLLKTSLDEGGRYTEVEMAVLRPLTSECYWLGCLMALNNPPLHPDWKNHVAGIDSWDIFPGEIKPVM